jgi:hypothetical protein
MQCSHLKRYSVAQQRDINFVRLYLQATTLANLVDLYRPGAVSLLALDGRGSANHITNLYGQGNNHHRGRR